MMIFSDVDTLFGLYGALSTVLIAVIVVVVRIGQKVAKMEEWIRLYERKNGGSGP